MKNNVELLIDSNRGIYAYQEFAKRFNPSNSYWNYLPEDESILKDGPENEFYLESWQDVLETAYYLDPEGIRYTLYEYEGNIFAVKDGHQFGEDLN